MTGERGPFTRQANSEEFAARYARQRSAAAAQLETRVLGHQTGVNGYTTVEEADALAHVLRLGPHDRIMDLGAGRGWPGVRIAATGTTLISTDLPVAGLRFARDRAQRTVPSITHYAVASDGRTLPFRSECLDVVVHAEVFC